MIQSHSLCFPVCSLTVCFNLHTSYWNQDFQFQVLSFFNRRHCVVGNSSCIYTTHTHDILWRQSKRNCLVHMPHFSSAGKENCQIHGVTAAAQAFIPSTLKSCHYFNWLLCPGQKHSMVWRQATHHCSLYGDTVWRMDDNDSPPPPLLSVYALVMTWN